MKRFFKCLLALLTVLLALHLWMNWPVRLAVPDEPLKLAPLVAPTQTVKLTLLRSGHIESLHAMNVRGGSWKPYNSGVMAVLLEHPQGRFLIDAGFGKNVQQHFLTTPALMQKVAKLEAPSNTVAELEKLGLSSRDLSGILLTHAHWDHTSGLEDLTDVPVLLPQAEIDFIHSNNEHVALVSQWKDQLTFKPIAFQAKPYQGFSESFDLFNDGSVVLVPMAGHTPGSVGIFVHSDSGQQLLFIGDSSWTQEGVDWPAEKPFIAKALVEHNAETVQEVLVQLHQLQQARPNLKIIPAHDERRYGAINTALKP